MSNTAKTTVSKCKFSIARKIAELANLGDGGKLDSFFNKTIKDINKNITAAKTNLTIHKFQFDQDMDKINEDLEDAAEAVIDAEEKVDMDRIGDNASQTAYIPVYLGAIKKAEDNVKYLEAKKKDREATYNAVVLTLDKKIASLEALATRIGKE